MRCEREAIKLGACRCGYMNVACADGSVRALSDKTDRKVWYALITRDGGEMISPDDLDR